MNRRTIMVTRDDLPTWLNGLGLVGDGVEVGVSEGAFSEVLLDKWAGECLHMVDPWRHFPPLQPDDPWWEMAPPFIERPWDKAKDRDARTGRNLYEDAHLTRMMKAINRVDRHGRDGRVMVHKMTSQEAAPLFPDDSLSFVYIDGNHSYEAVREDFRIWIRKIQAGGIISGHDYAPIRASYRGAWNRVSEVVDWYADRMGVEVFVTEKPTGHRPGDTGSLSWFMVKPAHEEEGS